MSDYSAAPTPAPGWYPDDANRAQERYWNGSEWTNDFRDAGVAQSPPPPDAPVQSRSPGSPRRGFLIAAVSVALGAVALTLIAQLLYVIGITEFDPDTSDQIGDWIKLAGYLSYLAAFGLALAAFLGASVRPDLLRIAAIFAAVFFGMLAVGYLYEFMNNLLDDATDGNALAAGTFDVIASVLALVAALLVLRGFGDVSAQVGGYLGKWFFLSALLLGISEGTLAISQIITTVGDANDDAASGITTGNVFLTAAYMTTAAAWTLASIGFKKPSFRERDQLLAVGGVVFGVGYLVAAVGFVMQINVVGDFFQGTIYTSLWLFTIATLVMAVAAGLASVAFFMTKRT